MPMSNDGKRLRATTPKRAVPLALAQPIERPAAVGIAPVGAVTIAPRPGRTGAAVMFRRLPRTTRIRDPSGEAKPITMLPLRASNLNEDCFRKTELRSRRRRGESYRRV